MSDIDLSSAYTAGARAAAKVRPSMQNPADLPVLAGVEAIRAAAPLIEAAVREQIAREIEADIVRTDDGTLNPFAMGQEYAARIVRGESR